MVEIILGIGVAAFLIYAAYFIVWVRSMMRMNALIDGFINRTEGNINATLIELKATLENTRKITGDVGAVTEEVRQISHTVASVDKGLQNLYGYVRDGLGPAAEANLAGLKAGIKTGVVTLVKNLREKEGSS
jgi:uncharacterized protein YoxC